MTGLSQDRTGNSVNPALRGISSLDSRRRTGSAGDAALWGKRLSPAAYAVRNAAILRAYQSGQSLSQVGRACSLSLSGVHRVLSRNPLFQHRKAREQSRRIQTRDRVIARTLDALVAEYECGFTQKEMAARHGVSPARINQHLTQHPLFTARVRSPKRGDSECVPDWVPARHAARFRRLAGANGQTVAQACLRNLLAWEARQ